MVEGWRARTAPGERLVMVGHGAAVVLPGDAAPELVERLWPQLEQQASAFVLVNALTMAGLDRLHDFALVARDGEAVRVLVRGDVQVSDLDSGEVLADGRQLLTWREATVTGVRAVRIGQEQRPAHLPLVLGAALANHVDIALDGSDPVAAATNQADDRTDQADEQDVEPATTPSAEVDDAADQPSEPLVTLDPVTTVPEPELTAVPAPEPTPALEPEPEAQPEPVLPEHELALSPSDHDGRTVYSHSIAATHKPSDDRATQVLAAPCAQGHPNPPGSHACRLCGAPVAVGQPQVVRRPPLAMLVSSTGESVELDGPVLIGRAPSADGYELGARLFTVPSPNQDISRTHLLVGPDGWAIEATDLESTNGTVLLRRGQEPVRVVPSQPVLVQVGDTLDLGDGVTIEVTNPTL